MVDVIRVVGQMKRYEQLPSFIWRKMNAKRLCRNGSADVDGSGSCSGDEMMIIHLGDSSRERELSVVHNLQL